MVMSNYDMINLWAEKDESIVWLDPAGISSREMRWLYSCSERRPTGNPAWRMRPNLCAFLRSEPRPRS